MLMLKIVNIHMYLLTLYLTAALQVLNNKIKKKKSINFKTKT